MKKNNLLLGILALALVFAITACSNGSDPKPEHVHDWGVWTQTTDPTCTTEGVETRVCKLDATHTETRPIAALGHDWGDWVVTTPATATADGEETRTCKHDATHKETRQIPCLYTTQDFTIGDVNFTFEYRKDDTTSWAKLNTALNSYKDYAINPVNTGTEPADTWEILVENGKTIKIIFDYSDDGKEVGFKALDTETLRVGFDYVIITNITRGILSNGFIAMLDLTDPTIAKDRTTNITR